MSFQVSPDNELLVIFEEMYAALPRDEVTRFLAAGYGLTPDQEGAHHLEPAQRLVVTLWRLRMVEPDPHHALEAFLSGLAHEVAGISLPRPSKLPTRPVAYEAARLALDVGWLDAAAVRAIVMRHTQR